MICDCKCKCHGPSGCPHEGYEEGPPHAIFITCDCCMECEGDDGGDITECCYDYCETVEERNKQSCPMEVYPDFD